MVLTSKELRPTCVMLLTNAGDGLYQKKNAGDDGALL
jgi:hypothetical protein